MTAPTLVDHPTGDPIATVVFAHGAGAGMEHPWMASVAGELAARGLLVVRFEFPYMAARRKGRRPGPDRMPKLVACMRDVLARQTGPIVLAGKSMGGRVATMLVDDCDAVGAIAFGYPFHPPGKPDVLRTAHLETLRTPLLILQGERDPFGQPAEVSAYELSRAVEVQWLPDGDHSLKPRKASGFTPEQHLATAAAAAAAFVRRRLG
ncbi:MAG TPA: alpha/beta fold hydrolase [bacterium]|nr:alpha/beta fold hydrolase [bacterium]